MPPAVDRIMTVFCYAPVVQKVTWHIVSNKNFLSWNVLAFLLTVVQNLFLSMCVATHTLIENQH